MTARAFGALRRSLLWKYSAYSSTLVAGLLLVLGGVTGYFTWRDTFAYQSALLQEKAGTVAVHIDSFVAKIEQPLSWTLASAAQAGIDVGSMRLEMTRLLQRLPPVTELRWIDASGIEQILVSRVDLDATGATEDRAKDARVLAALRDGTHASPLYFRRESEPYMSLAVAGQTKSVGVLIAEVNLRFVSDVIARERIGENGLAYVIDSAGLLVSHPDINRVLARTDLSGLPHIADAISQIYTRDGLTRDLNAQSVMAAASAVSRLRWTVVAELPVREAMAPVYSILWRVVMLGALGLLVALWASMMLARRMVRPIRALGDSAERIGAGQLDHRIDVGGGDELAALGIQLNRMAQQLQESYLTLESKIAERTEQLAAANQAKTRFLAAASHDLRQPMHALALTVGELHEHARDPALVTLARRIERSVDVLEDLLDALLDISKLDAGGAEPTRCPIPIQMLFDQLVDEFASVAEARELRFRAVPTSLWTESDPVLLSRILLNFVSNAVRYTNEGGIVIGCLRRGVEIDISVVDSGSGIAEDDLPRIFQEFYQAGNPERDRAKGLGLGLAIVQRAALLLGHSISVRSRIGKGSVFSVRVPVVAPQPVPGPEAPIPQWDLRGLRVIVIDDEAEARIALARLLEQWGCTVVIVGGPQDAFAPSAIAPDVVLCDLHLGPKTNGFDLLDALARHRPDPFAGVIITADTASNRIAEANAHGYRLLHKPVRPARLRALLEQMLRERAIPPRH